MKEKLDRPLNKYDLVLCLTLYSNLKDSQYALYIDDKTVYTKNGIVEQRCVYKISNLTSEQEVIKNELLKSYKNNSNELIPLNSLKKGTFYCTSSDKIYYLYLGNWKLKIDTNITYLTNQNMYNDNHHLFLSFKMDGSIKDIVFNAISSGSIDINIIERMIEADVYHESCELCNVIICDKPKFRRKMGSIDLSEISKGYSFTKMYYGIHMESLYVKYTFT